MVVLDRKLWLLVSVWLAVLCLVLSDPAARYYGVTRVGSHRSIRGFKNQKLSTARGFGKRAASDSPHSTIPVDWLAKEMTSDPLLARLLISRFLDHDGDGQVSSEELVRPPTSSYFSPNPPTNLAIDSY